VAGYGDPVLAALAITDDDATVVQIQVLHAESQALEKAQAAAVEQRRYEPVNPGEMSDDLLGFLLTENCWKPLGPMRTYDVVDPR
jgi:hypothetical protein